jgi:hypothetical protein
MQTATIIVDITPTASLAPVDLQRHAVHGPDSGNLTLLSLLRKHRPDPAEDAYAALEVFNGVVEAPPAVLSPDKVSLRNPVVLSLPNGLVQLLLRLTQRHHAANVDIRGRIE